MNRYLIIYEYAATRKGKTEILDTSFGSAEVSFNNSHPHCLIAQITLLE